MKIFQSSTPEYLSKDILEEEFVKTFKAFHRLQYIFGSCRVDTKHKFVTAPTRSQKCYTILYVLTTVVLDSVAVDIYFDRFHDTTIFILNLLALLGGFLTFLLNTIHARFFNGGSNAELYIRMQKLDRLMRIDKSKQLSDMVKNINNGSVIAITVTFIAILVVTCSSGQYVYFVFLGAGCAELIFVLELMCCSSIVLYFVIRLRFLNCIIKNHLYPYKKSKKAKKIVLLSNRNIKKLAAETHNFTSSDTDTNAYLKELFDCFMIFQNLYRFQLMIFCIKLVFRSLITFGIILFSIQKNNIHFIDTFSLTLCTLIDIVIAIFLGYRLQIFFGEVKETKSLSIAVMAKYSEGVLREKARKMFKMTEETPPRLSIYDMWEMNAGTFVTIFGLVTSLIVTLLQFAFL